MVQPYAAFARPADAPARGLRVEGAGDLLPVRAERHLERLDDTTTQHPVPRVALERSTAVALRPTVIGGSCWTARAVTSRSRRAASPGRAKVKRARSMHQHPRRTDVRVRRKSKTLVIHALAPVPGCAVAVCTRRRVIRPNQPAVGIASSKTG